MNLEHKHILVTAGPTHEPIDPVSYLATPGSGKTGFAIAAAAARAGARVTLVTGPTHLADPEGVEVLRVVTAQEMYDACASVYETVDAGIFTAAVMDFKPVGRLGKKIKKDGGVPECIYLEQTIDVLATLAARKEQRFIVGFAAETNDVISYAQGKLVHKNADMIVANNVSSKELGFGTDDNKVWFVSAEGVEDVPLCSKEELAEKIIEKVIFGIEEKRLRG